MSYRSKITSRCSRALFVGLLRLSACAEPETSAQDERCLDPRIGTEMLDDPVTHEAVRMSADPPVKESPESPKSSTLEVAEAAQGAPIA